MTPQLPLWAELLVAVTLVMSGMFALAGAWGLLRLKEFFQRMHPPALASTAGAWCACLASMISFSVQASSPRVHAWLIPILLSITVPVTTVLLARAALFRRRQAHDPNLPPPLKGRSGARLSPTTGETLAGADTTEQAPGAKAP